MRGTCKERLLKLSVLFIGHYLDDSPGECAGFNEPHWQILRH